MNRLTTLRRKYCTTCHPVSGEICRIWQPSHDGRTIPEVDMTRQNIPIMTNQSRIVGLLFGLSPRPPGIYGAGWVDLDVLRDVSRATFAAAVEGELIPCGVDMDGANITRLIIGINHKAAWDGVGITIGTPNLERSP